MHSDESLPREVGLTADIPPWDPQPETVQFGRIVDPVRAAALHEAVQVWHSGAVSDDGNQLDLILKTAARFEAYLAGTGPVPSAATPWLTDPESTPDPQETP